MIHLIYIYFIINVFIAGFKMGDDHFWWSMHKEDIKTEVIATVLIVFFGGILYVLRAIIYATKNSGRLINKYTQVIFFWEFLFTDKYRNIDDKVLKSINEIIIEVSDEQDFSGRLNLHCLEMVNRRHKYRHDG